MKRHSVSVRKSNAFTLLEVVISLLILMMLAGAVYAIVNSAMTASQTTMSQQLILRRLDAFLRLTREAFLNLPATGSVSLENGGGKGNAVEQRLVIARPQEVFGIPSLAGGSLVLAARARADGTRTMTMLTIPAHVTEKQRSDALEAPGVPLLPKLRKPRWSFKTTASDEVWKEELPSGSPRPILVRLQLEIDDLPNPVENIFYLPPITSTASEIPTTAIGTNAPSPTPNP